MQNPAQFKIPAWFLNRQRDMTDGKDAHVVSNGIDQKMREDLERLKKMYARFALLVTCARSLARLVADTFVVSPPSLLPFSSRPPSALPFYRPQPLAPWSPSLLGPPRQGTAHQDDRPAWKDGRRQEEVNEATPPPLLLPPRLCDADSQNHAAMAGLSGLSLVARRGKRGCRRRCVAACRVGSDREGCGRRRGSGGPIGPSTLTVVASRSSGARPLLSLCRLCLRGGNEGERLVALAAASSTLAALIPLALRIRTPSRRPMIPLPCRLTLVLTSPLTASPSPAPA